MKAFLKETIANLLMPLGFVALFAFFLNIAPLRITEKVATGAVFLVVYLAFPVWIAVQFTRKGKL